MSDKELSQIKSIDLSFDMINDGGGNEVVKTTPYCDMKSSGRTKANCDAACGVAGVSKWTMFHEVK